MEKSISRKMLFKFFEGKHTSFEAGMIQEWLKLDENKELYFAYMHEWEVLNPQVIVDIESRLLGLKNKVEGGNVEEKEESSIGDNNVKTSFFLKVAAAITAILLTGGYLVFNRLNDVTNISDYSTNVENARLVSGEIFEKQNLGSTPLLVNLPDGSSILLQPKTRISYNPKTFGIDRRELIMEGEAFFEVHKDKERPFLVYANDMIAKVLGTSFTIRTNQESNTAEVFVKSGKVSVFTQEDFNKKEKIEGKELQGVILEPAQKLEVGGKKQDNLKPEQVEQSDFLEEIEVINFNFNEVRAEDVFNTLEKAYNIKIVYDKDKWSSFRLTAHLGDEPLREKLKLICLALETSFEEIDDKILIKTKK
ncbi:FecR family protein [uncultured Arcticibacterium sp.]|uniref:FecR family protein n=1 Tax=uncultured Arcticibacterium sp. TaxID=2173042 RepID=UPI0030F57A5C